MQCPVCGAAELIHDTRDLPYTYKGETTVIPAVTADFCPACDESITDMLETERVMREMQPGLSSRASAYSSPAPTWMSDSLSNASPLPATRGFGSSIAATPRAMPASRKASAQGPVRPWWAQGSSVT